MKALGGDHLAAARDRISGTRAACKHVASLARARAVIVTVRRGCGCQMSAPPVNRTSQALSGVHCEKSVRHSPADCITAPKSGRANSKGSSGTAPADRAASHAPQNERRCPHPRRAGRGAARPRTTCHSVCERAASLPGVRRRFQPEGQARRPRHEDCKARSITNYERRCGGCTM